MTLRVGLLGTLVGMSVMSLARPGVVDRKFEKRSGDSRVVLSWQEPIGGTPLARYARAELNRSLDAFRRDALGEYRRALADKDHRYYEYEAAVKITYLSPTLISVSGRYDVYPGSQSARSCEPLSWTWSIVGGKPTTITLAKVLRKGDDVRSELRYKLTQWVAAHDATFDLKDHRIAAGDYAKDALEGKDEKVAWSVGENGLLWNGHSLYDGRYLYEIRLPWTQLGRLLARQGPLGRYAGDGGR